MQQIVSITSQGQVTIPVSVRRAFGIKGSAKASLRKRGEEIVIKPEKDFWSLSGGMKSKIKLTDKQLRDARKAFETDWAEE
ncbi:MAG: AbrB/MazE/SpoVT family DNA-binding domain-containing protein [Candidatus Beckwithbacteria bacterium]|nr:AbrB/MazE/SpoVT family DNA-binding domain-containing protein [Patescibacteria group bacterium]